MKYLFLLLAVFSLSAHAQVYTDATAVSGSASQSGSVSIANGGAAGAGGTAIGSSNFQVSPTVSINSTGSDLGEAVPLVTAPQMTVLGGEDSCLKSRSGGGAFSGFGASFGTMVMDDNCDARRTATMAQQMGRPDVAVAVLCGLPKFWAAMERLAKAKNELSVCNNEQPVNAGTVSAKLRDSGVGGGADDGLPWSYKPRKDDDFIYFPSND